MGSGQTSKIGRLVNLLMEKVAEVAGEDDWEEADGWVGKWTIEGPDDVTLVYEIRGGKFFETRERENYTGEVRMSEDTFLDLVDAALHGRGEQVFIEKYRKWHIQYFGEQWLVDSERFRKVLKRLGSVPLRSLL
ncbi:hypothetical protein LCGC14_1355110 [marine sediment metagenome]|uniref:SCP2 domain-containing protein n=1 Tax=marine sediment metagenome TaxID=412755 RepID=A0A0F9K9P7_9ZZZZ